VKDSYAALGIIHQTWSPVPGRIKDFIAMSRPNGYQSLHTSVISDRGLPFEVQIRTEEMHRRAEEGIAAHWKYKEGRVGAGRDEQYFQWLRQLLEWQQEVRDPQEFLTNLKIDLYPEEVYTFTPRGQVKVLPKGSTPVDFAYAVHTDVGHKCVGARVNGRMVPLRTRLKNGDIVEVMTNPAHKPSRDCKERSCDCLRYHLDIFDPENNMHCIVVVRYSILTEESPPRWAIGRQRH
jgi:GTP pyrophosphokinase